jgi:hypothetical protein
MLSKTKPGGVWMLTCRDRVDVEDDGVPDTGEVNPFIGVTADEELRPVDFGVSCQRLSYMSCSITLYEHLAT